MPDNLNYVWKSNKEEKPEEKGAYLCFLIKDKDIGLTYNFVKGFFNGDENNPVWTNIDNDVIPDNIVIYWTEWTEIMEKLL